MRARRAVARALYEDEGKTVRFTREYGYDMLL